jgi:hypothetical protein
MTANLYCYTQPEAVKEFTAVPQGTENVVWCGCVTRFVVYWNH